VPDDAHGTYPPLNAPKPVQPDLGLSMDRSSARGLRLPNLFFSTGMPHDMRLTFVGRRGALRTAIEKMIALEAKRVIVAYGR
jgi:hypothetical protein